MAHHQTSPDERLSLEVIRHVDRVCDEFEAALKVGAGVSVDTYLDRVEERARRRLLSELAQIALAWLEKGGADDPKADLLAANPTLRDDLASVLAGSDGARTVNMSSRPSSSAKASGLVVRCPHCRGSIDLIVDASLMDIECPTCGGSFSLVNDAQSTRDARTMTSVAHFELVERLGMGEFGTVWKARDTLLDRTVALKIPRREQLDPVSIEKFMREARAAAQLSHPNIIRTHEVGRDGDTLYIVNEYVRGVPLSEVLADHRLGIRDSVLMTITIADALAHAHHFGVIHRDLKPSNILVADDGAPYLMDFGLAKRNDREITITTEGAILGTPAYMSPEQARGEAHQVDGRSDIYSLGVVFFQLLTGELPFRGSTRMLLQKVIHDDPPSPRTLDGSVPKDLDTICLKCLEKEPSRRYATAIELAADLRRYRAGRPVLARRVGPLGRSVRWARRNRAVATLLAATIFTLLTASIVSSYFAWRAAENAARADQQALAVTDTLYDSLLQEMRLTREVRRQGYGDTVQRLVGRARNLPSTRVDPDELRRQLVLSMGDFVAYSPRVVRPQQGQTNSISLSHDGREIVVGLSNGRLLIYDATTGIERAELEAFADAVQSIAMTADGSHLIAAARNGTARTWRRAGEGWTLRQTMKIGAQAHSVFLSPFGELLVYLSGPVVDVWDVAKGAKLRSLATEADWTMRNAAIDLPNRRVAGSYMNEKADTVGWAVWDLDTGDRLHHEEMPALGNSYSNGIDVASDGSRLAIGFDESLLVYRLADIQQMDIQGFDSTKAVAFSPTSPYLAVANIRGSITIWNSVTARQLATLHHPKRGSSRDDLSFSGDGSRLASSNAESIHIWDLMRADEKTVLNGHNGGIPCAAFHPDGHLLVTGGKDDSIRFWNPATGQLLHSLELQEAVQALAFSADGKLLAVGCMGRAGAQHLKVVDVRSRLILHEEDPALGHVHSVAWENSGDGRYLGACGVEGVALWRVAGERPLSLEQLFKLERSWCLATTLSPDGRWMVWTQNDRRLEAWDIAGQKKQPLHAPSMHQGWHGVAFLSDGESIIYVSQSGVAQIWNIAEDRHVDAFGEPGTFNAPHIALSPNGKWFAALTQPDTVSIWHVPTRKHVFTLRPEAGNVWSLGWDPSSEHLAVGQSDGGLGVWHLPRIQEKLREAGLEWREDR